MSAHVNIVVKLILHVELPEETSLERLQLDTVSWVKKAVERRAVKECTKRKKHRLRVDLDQSVIALDPALSPDREVKT